MGKKPWKRNLAKRGLTLSADGVEETQEDNEADPTHDVAGFTAGRCTKTISYEQRGRYCNMADDNKE